MQSLIGPPYAADEECYIQTLFLGNAPPIVNQVDLGLIWEYVKNVPLFRNNQDALIFASGSVAFEFVNGKRSGRWSGGG